MARMKYHGEIPVLFNDLSRPPVKPGEEFDVPDSDRERYSRRDDIEDLDPPVVEEPEPEAEAEAEPEAEAAPVTEDAEAAPQPVSPDTTPAPAAEAAPPTE